MRTFATRLPVWILWAALVWPGTLAAQHPRSGFWMESTGGTGAARSACSGCEDVTVAYGITGNFRVGGALSARVLLGLEVFAHDASDVRLAPDVDPVEGENATIAPIVLWYVGDSGFFLKAGAGIARGTFTVQAEDVDPVTIRRTGSGLTFGVGFDIPVVRWLALSANFGTYVTAIGDVRVGDAVVDDVIATIYEAGVGLTVR